MPIPTLPATPAGQSFGDRNQVSSRGIHIEAGQKEVWDQESAQGARTGYRDGFLFLSKLHMHHS